MNKQSPFLYFKKRGSHGLWFVSLCFQLFKIHRERAVQEVRPLAEGHDEDGPLRQYGEVQQENPFVAFQDAEVDEQAHQEG